MIKGINHINLAVKDTEVAFTFYRDVLGFTPLCKSEGSAYFLAGVSDAPNALWVSLDLDRDGLRKPSPCNTHIAFSVRQEDFEQVVDKLLRAGVQVYKENTSPGDSLYFLDPDGHKLEIHAGCWQDRLAAKKADPGGWKKVEWSV